MFLYVCKQTFHISKVCISQRVKGVIMRNLCDTVFYIKTNVLQNFCFCISVPLSGMKTKSLIKLRISFLLKLNTDDLNQQIHYNKYLQKVILRTTEHLFSLNTSKSLLRETITRISKTSHALSKHQNIIYTIEVAYSC